MIKKTFRAVVVLFIASLYFACSEEATTPKIEEAQVQAVADTLLFTQGEDSLWVWWSANADLDGDGNADLALLCLPGPNLTGDSIVVNYFENEWMLLGKMTMIRSKQTGMLVGISPPGKYDFQIIWKRDNEELAKATASSQFPMLQQVELEPLK